MSPTKTTKTDSLNDCIQREIQARTELLYRHADFYRSLAELADMLTVELRQDIRRRRGE